MNITERMLLEGTMENRGVSSPKSAIRRAYLRTLVEEGTLPIRQEKPIKTAMVKNKFFILVKLKIVST